MSRDDDMVRTRARDTSTEDDESATVAGAGRSIPLERMDEEMSGNGETGDNAETGGYEGTDDYEGTGDVGQEADAALTGVDAASTETLGDVTVVETTQTLDGAAVVETTQTDTVAETATDTFAETAVPEPRPTPSTTPGWFVPVVIFLVLVIAAGLAVLFVIPRRRERSSVRLRRTPTARTRVQARGHNSSRSSDGGRMRRMRARGGVSRDDAGVPHTFASADVDSLRIGKLHGQGARPEQQDSFGVSDAAMVPTHGQLVVVCDGMGGMENGGAVSQAAVETILSGFLLVPAGSDPTSTLLSLTVDANQKVNALLGPDVKKSGSTLVMALVKDSFLYFLSIGDSRICLFRDGELMQLNREHVYVNELVLRAVNGEMSLYDALYDSQAKSLMSYLGMGSVEAIDVPSAPLRLRERDMVVLMTDGVYNALTPDEISQALSVGEPDLAAERLSTAIEDKRFENQDNYTAVVVAV